LLDEYARSQGLSLADTIGYADSTSDLPMLEAAGFPVIVNPEAKLAAIARRRGWFIENWERAEGGPPTYPRHRHPAPWRADKACELAYDIDERRSQMKALQFERNLPGSRPARVASTLVGSGNAVRLGPLELVEIEPFAIPGPGWVRVRPRLAGILRLGPRDVGRPQLRYFEQIVSFPFIPGHEVVCDVESGASRASGRSSSRCSGAPREPSSPVSRFAQQVAKGSCERIAFGPPCVPGSRPDTAATPGAAGRPGS